jgi:hypothetical protein
MTRADRKITSLGNDLMKAQNKRKEQAGKPQTNMEIRKDVT